MAAMDNDLGTAERPPQPDPGPQTPPLPSPASFGVIPGLVWAFRIHGDGQAEPLAIDKPVDDSHDGWLWLHFNLTDVRGNAWLADAEELPVEARTLLLSPDNTQQLHTVEGCIYGVFADLVRRLDRPSSEIGFLRFALTERLLVSGRHHPLNAVEATRQTIESGRRLPSAAGLLEIIVEQVVQAIDHAADRLSDELDDVEEALVSGQLSEHQARLGRVRRTAVRLHRQLLGMRTVFHRLEREGLDALKPALRLSAARLAQRLDGLDHDIMEIRDRAHVLQEELSAKLSEQTNRQLSLLTVVTTLLLPPTLITGIFGMNTKGLPLTDDENGFLWAMALLFASSGAIYLLMRRMGIVKR